MEYLPYNLKGNNITSDKFYKEIRLISEKIKTMVLNKGGIYLESFMKYVVDNKLEKIKK